MSVFRRAQIEAALWSVAHHGRLPGAMPPPRFLARIKKLLDLDRTLAFDNKQLTAPRAFCERADIGQGVDAAYTHFNTFCLALGLDLLETGFKQSEIVSFFRHVRGHIERAYSDIIESSPRLDVQVFAKPGEPAHGGPKGRAFRDFRCYMVVGRIETTESFPAYAAKGEGRRDRMMFVPQFYFGVEALKAAMDERPSELRRSIVVECTDLAIRLRQALEQAKPVRRGPSSR